MRSVHLLSVGESPAETRYRPTAGPGAPLIVESVPDAVSDYDVARLASSCEVSARSDEYRIVEFGALERHVTGG